MGEKNFTIVEIIVAIVITIIIMLLFWENDASNLRDDISVRDEKIQELENEIEAENPELSGFQEQLDEIQSTVDNIYDGLTIEEPVLDENGNPYKVKQ
jgi:peptidoglycan hydrolase CwlO-like protein